MKYETFVSSAICIVVVLTMKCVFATSTNVAHHRRLRLYVPGTVGGLADRMKSTLYLAELARMEQRDFVRKHAPARTYTLSCVDSCWCLGKLFRDGFPREDVQIISNMDCAYLMFRHPRYNATSSFNELAYYNDLYADYAKLEIEEPDVAIHVRTGHFTDAKVGDPERVPPSAVHKYLECVHKAKEFGVIPHNASVFVASDNRNVLKRILAQVPNSYANNGPISHLDRSPHGFSSPMNRRMIHDFESLRRARHVLISSPSGFSLMAYRVRVHHELLILDGQSCRWPAHQNVVFPPARPSTTS